MEGEMTYIAWEWSRRDMIVWFLLLFGNVHWAIAAPLVLYTFRSLRIGRRETGR
jgi:hypothetical protein